jgi:hypothetical protein
MTVQGHPSPATDQVTRRRLSANEDFLRAFDRGDDLGVFGPRCLIVAGCRLRGRLDPAMLQLALNDVVERHEGLRTTIVRDPDDPHARVHPPSPARLTVSELSAEDREQAAHQYINEVEAERLDPGRMPLLRAALGRFDDDDAVLVLVTHHSVGDAWSMHLIMRDVANCYARRRGLAAELPPVRQYGEYASWQQQSLDSPDAAEARQYWRAKLAGGQMLTLPTDRQRRLTIPPVYSVYRFLLDQQLISATTALARSMRSSPFMVLYACFNLFLHRRTGLTDIIAPTLTSGRAEPEFHQTVGPLFNFMPIRTDISDCLTFRDLMNQTRASLLEAYSYELPFREIMAEAEPELMRGPLTNINGVTTALEVFQSPQAMDGELIGDVRYTGLRRRLISASDASEIPDGNLWAFDLDPAGDLVGIAVFNSLDFDASTIVAMIDEYRELLRSALASPDSALLR